MQYFVATFLLGRFPLEVCSLGEESVITETTAQQGETTNPDCWQVFYAP
jgi:hypothetical protein